MNKYDKAKADSRSQLIRINQNIRCPYIKIVGDTEVISNSEAQLKAKNLNMDLVEVNFIRDRSGSPVSICKIMDYGKYVYDKKKAEKLAAKKARESRPDLKVIQFHLTADTADVNRKCNKIKEIVLGGDKVRAEIFFRGREQKLEELTKNMLDGIIEKVKDVASLESPPKYEGRTYNCILKRIKVQNNNSIKIKVS